MELGQISAVYLNDLLNTSVFSNRRILKATAMGQKQDTTMLEVLNQQFSQYALNVTLRREHFIKELIIG